MRKRIISILLGFAFILSGCQTTVSMDSSETKAQTKTPVNSLQENNLEEESESVDGTISDEDVPVKDTVPFNEKDYSEYLAENVSLEFYTINALSQESGFDIVWISDTRIACVSISSEKSYLYIFDIITKTTEKYAVDLGADLTEKPSSVELRLTGENSDGSYNIVFQNAN